MNIKTVAAIMHSRVTNPATGLPEYHDEYGKEHLRSMCLQISEGEVTGEKAHRWLGWIQACVCIGGGATLDELKEINHVN